MFDYVFINTHPIQYNAPFYRLLAKDLNICVYYLSDKEKFDTGFNRRVKWDIDLYSGYKKEFFNKHLFGSNVNKRWGIFSLSLLRKLWLESRGQKYVIPAWNPWIFMFAAAIIRIRGGVVVLRIETPANQYFLDRPSYQSFVRYGQIYLWKYLTNWYLYIGTQNKRLWQRVGVGEDKLLFAGYCVDNLGFRGDNDLKLTEHNGTLTKFVFVGKLSKKKRLDFLVNAFISASSEREDLHLSVVGDGELREWLIDYTQKIPNISYLGFKNQSELAAIYKTQDCIILPSGYGETWGLVVNEALNFGLAAITSDCVGSGYDLITDKNGRVFKLDNKESLVRAILEVGGLGIRKSIINKENQRLLDYYSFDSYKNTLITLNNK